MILFHKIESFDNLILFHTDSEGLKRAFGIVNKRGVQEKSEPIGVG